MAIKSSTKKKTNQNYSAKLADGRRVTVKDGVKTYSGTANTAPAAKNTGSGGGGGNTQVSQLEQMRQTLLKLQSDLQSGKVTGLDPSPTKTTTPTVTPAKTSTYSGPSVVDYLASTGQASDLASRMKLGSQYGIDYSKSTTNYAAENTALLNKLRLNTSSSIPSTAITNPVSTTDVMDKRAQLESLQTTLKSKQDELAALLASSQEDMTVTDTGEVTNYDKFLTRYNTQGFEKTAAQLEQERLLGDSASATEDFYKNRDKNIEKAYDEYGVTTKQTALANIQKEMAQREVRLRESIKALETAPEYRGVSREFAVDQREAIKSEGAFDLANLAIVESAYRGDLETSRSLAQDLIDNQFNTFEGKLAGYKARLAALMPQLNADEKRQALQLEQAFNAQERALAEKKADTELRYEYMSLAAQAGAPESVYKAILKATSADEAFMLAAPYMQKKTTGTTGGVGTPVGGITPVVPGMSPWTSGLAKLDLQDTKTKIGDIKAGVRKQFDTAFSSKLIGTLTDEQLREFLIGYQSAMMEAGMSLPPEEIYQKYLEYIGKGASTGGSSREK